MRGFEPAVLLVAALALACVPATTGRSAGSGGELEELKRRVIELQRQARVAEVEIERLRRQVAALEARQPAGAGASAAVPTSPARPDTAPPRAVEPPALVERDELTLEPAGGAPAVRESPPSARPAPAPSAEAPPSEPRQAPVTAEAQALYDRGYTFYHQGRYVDAETTFQQFIQQHGDNDLADNAQYWIGEARFARKDIAGALAAFRETVDRFPRGNKVADAQLKVGDCLAQLGDTEGARAEYDKVVRRFPNTAAAAMAEERRDQLD